MPGKFLDGNFEKIWSQIFPNFGEYSEDKKIRKFWNNLHVFQKSAETHEKFWNRIFCANYNIYKN